MNGFTLGCHSFISSKVDNRDALRHLFTKYWSNPSGASFVADYTTNNHQFNSDNERMALKNVLVQIGEKYNTSMGT